MQSIRIIFFLPPFKKIDCMILNFGMFLKDFRKNEAKGKCLPLKLKYLQPCFC